MKQGIKKIALCLLMVCVLAGYPAIQSFAAAKKIETVRLNFSYRQKPEAGAEVGTVAAMTNSKEFAVEEAVYTNDKDIWELGDRPEVKVTLSAADGYRFSYTTGSHFKLTGGGAELDRAKIYDGGQTLVVEATLKRVDGKLDPPDSLEWDGAYAMWSEVEGAKEYEVRLYRNRQQAAVVTVRDTVYNFYDEITREGTYTFRVRGISRYDGKAGTSSDYSDENTFTEGEIGNTLSKGGWIQNKTGWWYRYNNGDYPVSCWKFMDGRWYYFNGDGYMLIGWQKIGGHWYYLDMSGAMTTGWQYINNLWYYMDGNGMMRSGWQYVNNRWYYLSGSGAMLTGWQYINDLWYYLDGSGAMLTGWRNINDRWYYLDGSGAMLTGWRNINDRWYYLDGSGAMYAGRTTPDGYYVNGLGEWVR